MSRNAKPILLIAGLIFAACPVSARELARQAVPHKWFEPLVPEALPKLEHPDYFQPLDRAKAELAHGRYKLALATLHTDGAQIDPMEVALVRGEALAALGRSEEALAALSAPGIADAPRVQVLRAAVLSDIGRHHDAIEQLQAHLRAHPGSIAGHYHLGAVSERLGDLDAAAEAYGWFTQDPQRYLDKWQGQGPESFDSAQDVTLIARALDRHAVLTGAYRGNVGLNNTILDMFVRAYDQIERGYVPAHVAAAGYFIGHDDRRNASEELKRALAINPNHAEALELSARVAIEERNLPVALALADQLREVNPSSVTADLIELHAVVRGDRSGRASHLAAKLLAKQPNHLEALGLAAAVAFMRGEQAGADAYLARADAAAPHSPVALLALADALPDLYQYAAAERYCKLAVDRAPLWARPRHRLGSLLMHLAREDEAHDAFEAAYELDPFNVATVNYLRVLDDMKSFETIETGHFVIKFDPKLDPILGEYLGPMMEQAHEEICARFKFTPPQATVLEVFPTTDSFSVRTAGLPGAETYGAALGRVITAVAPRAGATLGPFNFARVLRHEFTHVVNLQQTDFRCPRWLTEGLAVSEEGVPFRFAHVPKAVHEVATKQQFAPVVQLSGSVLRPRSQVGGEMLYMQGFWITRYLAERYGPESVLKLLEGYKLAKSDDDAFRHAIGKPTAEFDREFAAWAKEQVKDWGYDAETTKAFDALVKTGEEQIKTGALREALETWQKAAALQPHNPLPHRRLSGLHIRLGSPKDALPHLQAFLPLELQENRYAKAVARIHRDAGDFEEAKRFATEAVYINPYDADAHELLLAMCEKTDDGAGVERERRVLARLETLKRDLQP